MADLFKSKDEFYIQLKEERYYIPGESISGEVILDLQKATKTNNIKVTLEGTAEINGKVVTLFTTFVLIAESLDEPKRSYYLESHTHRFPFRITIPSSKTQKIPSSLEIPNLIKVNYRLIAIHNKPFTFFENFCPTTSLPVTILEDINVERVEYSGEQNLEKELLLTGEKVRTVKVSAIIKKRAAVKGDVIPINVTIEHIGVMVRDRAISAQLFRSVHYGKNKTEVFGPELLHQVFSDIIILGPINFTKTFNMKLPIPSHICPTVDDGDDSNETLFKIEYFLRISVNLNEQNPHRPETEQDIVTFNTPFIIGTYPKLSFNIDDDEDDAITTPVNEKLNQVTENLDAIDLAEQKDEQVEALDVSSPKMDIKEEEELEQQEISQEQTQNVQEQVQNIQQEQAQNVQQEQAQNVQQEQAQNVKQEQTQVAQQEQQEKAEHAPQEQELVQETQQIQQFNTDEPEFTAKPLSPPIQHQASTPVIDSNPPTSDESIKDADPFTSEPSEIITTTETTTKPVPPIMQHQNSVTHIDPMLPYINDTIQNFEAYTNSNSNNSSTDDINIHRQLPKPDTLVSSPPNNFESQRFNNDFTPSSLIDKREDTLDHGITRTNTSSSTHSSHGGMDRQDSFKWPIGIKNQEVVMPTTNTPPPIISPQMSPTLNNTNQTYNTPMVPLPQLTPSTVNHQPFVMPTPGFHHGTQLNNTAYYNNNVPGFNSFVPYSNPAVPFPQNENNYYNNYSNNHNTSGRYPLPQPSGYNNNNQNSNMNVSNNNNNGFVNMPSHYSYQQPQYPYYNNQQH